MEIRRLRDTDEVTRFACGEPDLDRFIKKYAKRNQDDYLGTTYVLAEGASVLAYVTVAAAQVRADELPVDLADQLPSYPLPVLRLARLAVDSGLQGQGVGRQLLRVVFDLALGQAEKVGCVGVVVDAKPGAAEYYRRYGFFDLEVLAGGSEARPAPTAMFLPLVEIRAARAARSPDQR